MEAPHGIETQFLCVSIRWIRVCVYIVRLETQN